MPTLRFILASAFVFCGSAWAAVDSTPDELSVRQAAWHAYRVDLQVSLVRSGTARDLVLAAMIGSMLDFSEAAGGEINPSDLYQSASLQAGDDVLVHWLLATQTDHADVQRQSAKSVQVLEPDNGMVWLLALNSAAQDGDEEGVTSALKRMEESNHFATHSRELVVLWLDTVDRFPDVLTASFPDDEVAAQVRIGAALAHAYASSYPEYQVLLTECSKEKTAMHSVRSNECIAIGKKMVSASRESLSMGIGNVVLIKLNVLEAAEQARNIAWRRRAHSEAIDALPGDSGAGAILEEAWRASSDEIEFQNRIITLAGLSLVPPADWAPDSPTVAPNASPPGR